MIFAQTQIEADPFYLLQIENDQFQNSIPIQSNMFRPVFFQTDTVSISLTMRSETYFNNNIPNQENMDIRYFSKGMGNFNSLLFSFNSPYFSLMAEPYILRNNYSQVKTIKRDGFFSVLNDQPIENIYKNDNHYFRNLLGFIHYKGIGFGWHNGNRWWGPGIHTSLQMTNNTIPFPAQIIGTINEIRVGKIGIFALYTFSKLNEEEGYKAKYFTSLNAQLTWYGQFILSAGFSRNYLSGGTLSASGRVWSASDAKKLIFEGIFTSNLIDNEYTVGGHDEWDQTLSGYLSVILPKREIKIYAEMGFNDNRLFFADFLSQPDHSMATVFGVRDYGLGSNKNLIWGFEWANLMISYTSRHRGAGGSLPWYSRGLYNYSSYNGRRWGAHSGGDSDDWYLYAGYLSNKLAIIPAINYERHGVVSHRPAEVKIELRLDLKYQYRNIWFGLYFEKQFEAFLGFPDHFYEDKYMNPISSPDGELAQSRRTNTLIFSIYKKFNL